MTGNPCHLGLALEGDQPAFYDYPTTLHASHEALQMVLAGNADADRYALAEKRELNNFERTLRTLLQGPGAAEFRDSVNLTQLE